MKARFGLCAATESILVFDPYTKMSAKGHERQRQAGVGSTTFNLDLCQVVMQWWWTNITCVACHVLSARSTWGVGCQLKAGMMACSYTMKQTSPSSTSCFRSPMLVVRWSEFSTMTATFSSCWSTGWGFTIYRFVLLCRWRRGVVLCQLRGHSMLTATWSPCKSNAFLGLFDVLGEENATQADFMAVGQQLFAALYGQEMGTSMTQLGTICAAANSGSHCASCYCLQWKHTATCSPVDVALKGSWRTGSFRCLHIRVWLENRRWDNLPQVWPLSSEEQGI